MVLQASNIIDRVRVHLDQVPLTNEDVRTDSSIIGSASTNFSDADLLQRINQAEKEIISRVKAQHVPLAVFRYDTADSYTLPTITEQIVRLLYSRVIFSGSAGDPNTTAPYDPQGYFDGAPDNSEIMYQLIAGRVINVTDIDITTGTNPTTTQSATVTVDGVTVATITLNTSGTHGVSITGGNFNVNTGQIMRIIAGSSVDAEDFSFAFTATAEVFASDTVEGIRAVQRNVDRNRRLAAAGRAASGSYPVYTYEDGELNVYPSPDDVIAFIVRIPGQATTASLYNGNDWMTVDSRFEAAVIYRVIASCYDTMRDTDRSQFAYSIFEDEIAAYSIHNRINQLIDDREVDVE